MNVFRRGRRSSQGDHPPDRRANSVDPVGYNPGRDEYLFWLTGDGYIVAQDVACQHEYVQQTPCDHCGGELVIVAHLNRAGQGLSELVTVCGECHQRANFIFDISNNVYQAWWADQLGPLYIQQYDGDPREPVHPA
jgi:hypothetical protein